MPILTLVTNLGMGGSDAVVVVIPSVAISARFTIRMPPNDRDISMAFDDRMIRIPPNRRKVDIS